MLSEAVDATVTVENRCLHGRALLERMNARIYTGSWLGPAEELALAWVPVFTESGDHRGLALAHWMLGWVWMVSGRAQDAHRSYELAWRHAQQAGETRLALDILGSQRMAINIGPTPASESLLVFGEYAEEVGSPLHQARLELAQAWVLAMQGARAESRRLLASSRATYQELGLPLEESVQTHYFIEVMAGDASAATEDLLAAVHALEALGETNLLATISGMLADALVNEKRYTEAEHFSPTRQGVFGPGRRRRPGALAQSARPRAGPARRDRGGRGSRPACSRAGGRH